MNKEELHGFIEKQQPNMSNSGMIMRMNTCLNH